MKYQHEYFIRMDETGTGNGIRKTPDDDLLGFIQVFGEYDWDDKDQFRLDWKNGVVKRTELIGWPGVDVIDAMETDDGTLWAHIRAPAGTRYIDHEGAHTEELDGPSGRGVILIDPDQDEDFYTPDSLFKGKN